MLLSKCILANYLEIWKTQSIFTIYGESLGCRFSRCAINVQI